jgi:hypothetical protein
VRRTTDDVVEVEVVGLETRLGGDEAIHGLLADLEQLRLDVRSLRGERGVELLHLLLHALRPRVPRVLIGQHARVDVQPRQLLIEVRHVFQCIGERLRRGAERALEFPQFRELLLDFVLLRAPGRLGGIDIGQIPFQRVWDSRAVALLSGKHYRHRNHRHRKNGQSHGITLTHYLMARAQLRDGWPDLSDEELLDVRMSDLPLAIEGTLGARIAQLRAELDARDLRFPLHFYLSDEWFTPDGATAIAIPFYLSHPRLEKLEEAQMLEVEGGEHEWCMRILRHEAGHAIDNAFRLRRRRQRQHTFGSPSQPYPEFYTPKPYSKSFVLHLDSWYAQSHPDEDFAETFAVWLTPNSEWRQRYAGWRALGKLEYMDSLMDSLAGATAPVQNSEEVDPLNALRSTLRQHYRNKRR